MSKKRKSCKGILVENSDGSFTLRHRNGPGKIITTNYSTIEERLVTKSGTCLLRASEYDSLITIGYVEDSNDIICCKYENCHGVKFCENYVEINGKEWVQTRTVCKSHYKSTNRNFAYRTGGTTIEQYSKFFSINDKETYEEKFERFINLGI